MSMKSVLMKYLRRIRIFRAYTVSFDGTVDKWGIPEWVAYELHKTPQGLGKGPKRPSNG